MNKLSHALVLTAALAWGGAVPAVHADPIVSLAPTELPASTFSSLYDRFSTASSSHFQFAGAPFSPNNVVESQVFQSKADPSLYAYAYQIGVDPSATSSTGDPAHVDSASFHFGATPVPVGTDSSGHPSYSYVVRDGQVGDLRLPQAAPGGGIQTPTELSWQSTPTTGVVRAKFEDQASGAQPLTPGANSATFLILSHVAPPETKQFVNLQSSDPQVSNLSTSDPFTTVYAPTGGTIGPLPPSIPEPATLLTWAGMAGAVALVRRVRKSRAEAL